MDTGRPIRVPDAFASEIRNAANPIFRARLNYSMHLCIMCHNRFSGAIIFSVFLIHILRNVDSLCKFNKYSFKNNNKLKFKTATVWQNYFRFMALASATAKKVANLKLCNCKKLNVMSQSQLFVLS